MIPIRAVSNQKNYDEYWSGDPAFVQLAEDADEEQIKAHVAKIEHARRTSDWSALAVEGSSPTKFVMRPLRRTQLDWLIDQYGRLDTKKIGDNILANLIFRCTLVEVVNCDGFPAFKHENEPYLGKMIPESILACLPRDLVTELAGVAFKRARDLDPL